MRIKLSLCRFIGCIFTLNVAFLVTLLVVYDEMIVNRDVMRAERTTGKGVRQGAVDDLMQTSTSTSFPAANGYVPTEGVARERTAKGRRIVVKCLKNNVRPQLVPEEDSWKPVDSHAYVYSAYHDIRDKDYPIVRIIAIVEMTVLKTYYCQIWHGNSTAGPHIVKADVQVSFESHERRFGFALISCLLQIGLGSPEVVSLTSGFCDSSPKNHLLVHSPLSLNAKSALHNYTVCVTPLNFNFSNIYALVEMIEVNRLLGADRFIFYDYSTGPDVRRYLDMYKRQGLVEVLPWKVHLRVDKWPPDKTHPPQIHYFGQVAALNDCAYRSMFSSRYAVFTDLDEFIIPRQQDVLTWDEMLKAIDDESLLISRRLDEIGAYVFRNTFFRTDLEDDSEILTSIPAASKFHLSTLLKLRREWAVQQHGSRSKYIGLPLRLIMVGVHGVEMFSKSSQALHVDVQFGLVHHYRSWLGGTSVVERDATMLKYKDSILQRITDRLSEER